MLVVLLVIVVIVSGGNAANAGGGSTENSSNNGPLASPVNVPDEIGFPMGDAVDVLTNNFKVNYDAPSSCPSGKYDFVTSEHPRVAADGSTIYLTGQCESTGIAGDTGKTGNTGTGNTGTVAPTTTAPAMYAVPNFVGMTVFAAENVPVAGLAGDYWSVSGANQDCPSETTLVNNIVTSQTPPPGTLEAENDAMNVTVKGSC